jgi:hypothetical protein
LPAGGRTGVLRSSYQAALQVAALHIGALHINALQSLLYKSMLYKSMTAINFSRWTPRQTSVIIETSSHLLCSK